MSELETFIWYVIGYSTMPAIFIVGFVITAAVACFLLETAGKDQPEA